ncbi:unnamed protein product [Ectocarpus sp. CCAP 1310/34]|nr:unnamed protein product [Ectocarpus sp. CCAP 1310/34]
MVPGVVQASAPHPVDIFLEHVHAVEGVKHVVQDAAGGEDVVDVFLGAVPEAELEDPETSLQDTEEALNVLAHALKRPRESSVLAVRRVLGRSDEGRPLFGRTNNSRIFNKNSGG